MKWNRASIEAHRVGRNIVSATRRSLFIVFALAAISGACKPWVPSREASQEANVNAYNLAEEADEELHERVRYQAPKNCAPEELDIGKLPVHFSISIVSGTLAGQTFDGGLRPAVEVSSATPSATLDLSEFRFCYLGQVITLNTFDSLYGSKPTAVYEHGKLVRLVGVGGSSTSRFGFNDGFERNQFGRDSEVFVRTGHDYFGYLNEAHLVDGAGVIRYSVH